MLFPGREMRVGVSSGIVEFLTWIYIGCVVLGFVQASSRHSQNAVYAEQEDSREQIPPRAVRQVHFYVSTRYGRSDPFVKVKPARAMKIVPRVDRFFLGSRYGKRSLEDQQVIFYPNYASTGRLSEFDEFGNDEENEEQQQQQEKEEEEEERRRRQQQEDEVIANTKRSVENNDEFRPSIRLRKLIDVPHFGHGLRYHV